MGIGAWTGADEITRVNVALVERIGPSAEFVTASCVTDGHADADRHDVDPVRCSVPKHPPLPPREIIDHLIADARLDVGEGLCLLVVRAS